MRFGQSGKLIPRYIGRYCIIEQVGQVVYQLLLPKELSKVHNIFQMSQLRKYISDLTHVIEPQLLQLREDVTYEK